ncbi:MAG TPA: cohesin domain-containing protein [Terriglobales bacterium]
MRRAIRPAAILLLVAAICLPGISESAKSLYNKGKDAEAKQNYERAYEYFKQAYDQKPQDLAIRASFERLRFLAGASHVHRGQLLRDAGKLQEAMAEFQKAAEIDASSFIAQQEVRRTQKMIDAASQPAPGPRSATPAEVLDKRLANAKGPVELAPIANVPITLKVTDDSKRIYETVGKLAGINVLFDPDYTSRRVPVELNGVTLEEAMGVIALESKTFWRPVTPNTIFVAQDNPAKRRELEQNVLKTFYLANVSQNTEIQEVVNTLRSILEIQKVQPLPSQGAIVVRGTPDQVLLAEKLINDLDRSKPEVVVEVAVMQVSKDKKHNLGINPGTSASISLQNNVNTNTGNGNNNNNNNNSSNSNGINLNRLGNLNATDFVVSLPTATVTALYSDANTKILQNPSVRSVDGQKASLKIGDRVPVATGSFQPGIGGVGINPLVNTQFQYLDVGVNIDITPRIHAGGEVTLKIAMDISSVTSTSNIGGISQPVIGQRKIEHEIRLKDGEPSLMGGMFETDDIRSVSGIPGLSQIPLLKYLFSETDIEHRKNEIVFVLVPHIVRGPEYSDLNQSALEIGTGTAIDIRRASAAAPAQPTVAQVQPRQQSVAQPAPQIPQPQQPMPAQQPTVQPAAQSVQQVSAQGSAAFGFDPPNIVQPTGSTFAVNVMINGAQNVYSVPLQVSYDPKVLQVVNVSNGGILSQDGQAVTLLHREDESTGTMQITATRPPGAAGVSGGGAVVTLTFLAKGAGQSMLTISKGGARDPSMQPMPVAGAVGTVTVQ